MLFSIGRRSLSVGRVKTFSIWVIIECEKLEEAIALLKAAREHCPGGRERAL